MRKTIDSNNCVFLQKKTIPNLFVWIKLQHFLHLWKNSWNLTQKHYSIYFCHYKVLVVESVIPYVIEIYHLLSWSHTPRTHFHLSCTYVIWSKPWLCWYSKVFGGFGLINAPPSFDHLGDTCNLINDNSVFGALPLLKTGKLVDQMCHAWYLGVFFALLDHLLLPRTTPTHPFTPSCLSYPHLCPIMLQPCSHGHS